MFQSDCGLGAAEFLTNQDCNYISVDWGRLVEAPNYPGGVLNVAKAGLDLGNLILFLVRQGQYPLALHLSKKNVRRV